MSSNRRLERPVKSPLTRHERAALFCAHVAYQAHMPGRSSSLLDRTWDGSLLQLRSCRLLVRSLVAMPASLPATTQALPHRKQRRGTPALRQSKLR